MEQKEKSQLKVLTQKLRGLQNEALAQANHAEQHFLHISLLGWKLNFWTGINRERISSEEKKNKNPRQLNQTP